MADLRIRDKQSGETFTGPRDAYNALTTEMKQRYEIVGPADAPAPAAPQPQAPAAPPSYREMVERNPGAVIGAGTGTMAGYGLTPKTSVMPGATLLRMAPAAIPNSWYSGAASGVAEAAAQAAEQGVGAREEFDPLSIGLAAATPPLIGGAAQLWPAFQRTATRLLPGRFAAQHQAAQKAGAELVERVGPAAGEVGRLGSIAEEQTREIVPVTNLVQTLSSPGMRNLIELGEPVRAGNEATAKTARNILRWLKKESSGVGPVAPSSSQEIATIGQELTQPGGATVRGRVIPGTGQRGTSYSMELGKLEAIREDIGQLATKDRRIGQIYKSIVADLESAGAAGGTGAQAARDMAAAFKQTLGANSVKDALEAATTVRTMSGANVPVLNIGKFGNDIYKQREALTAQLGPEGYAALQDFVTKYRSLPPAQAYTFANSLIGGIMGAGGMTAGGLGWAIGMPLGMEFARNLSVVATKPGAWAQLMQAAAQGVRGQVTAAPPDAE